MLGGKITRIRDESSGRVSNRVASGRVCPWAMPAPILAGAVRAVRLHFACCSNPIAVAVIARIAFISDSPATRPDATGT